MTSYLTVSEVATALRTSTKTVRSLCARGELPARKAGRAWVVPAWAVDGYVPRPDASAPRGGSVLADDLRALRSASRARGSNAGAGS